MEIQEKLKKIVKVLDSKKAEDIEVLGIRDLTVLTDYFVIANGTSTTHTKTTAIMGVGAAKRITSVNWGVVGEMGLTWVLTFPGCGIIGYITAKIFLTVF